jgi:hypothetical protein
MIKHNSKNQRRQQKNRTSTCFHDMLLQKKFHMKMMLTYFFGAGNVRIPKIPEAGIVRTCLAWLQSKTLRGAGQKSVKHPNSVEFLELQFIFSKYLFCNSKTYQNTPNHRVLNYLTVIATG